MPSWPDSGLIAHRIRRRSGDQRRRGEQEFGEVAPGAGEHLGVGLRGGVPRGKVAGLDQVATGADFGDLPISEIANLVELLVAEQLVCHAAGTGGGGGGGADTCVGLSSQSMNSKYQVMGIDVACVLGVNCVVYWGRVKLS